MHSLTCVSVVVCVVRKPRPCLSYSRRRDRINSVLWRSYYKRGGGGLRFPMLAQDRGESMLVQRNPTLQGNSELVILVILNIHKQSNKFVQKILPITSGSHQPRSDLEVG